MKRILVCLTAALLCLSLAGCYSPYQAYRSAAEKTSALSAVDCSYTFLMELKVGAYEQTTEYSGAVAAVKDETDPRMRMTVQYDGKPFMSGYYEGGFLYSDMGGVKAKLEPSDEQLEGVLAQTEALYFEESDILKSELLTQDGRQVYRATVTADALPDMIAPQLEGYSLDAGDYTFSDMTLQVVFDGDGYIAEQTLQYSLSAEFEGRPGVIDIRAAVVFYDPGEPVTIESPTDLDSYEPLA